MRKKQIERFRNRAAVACGLLNLPEDAAKALAPTMASMMLFGYYLGLGYDDARAADKAQEVLMEMYK